MPTPTGTSNARRAALAAQAREGWTNSQLATKAGVDPATVRDFLDGSRWPKPPTLAKLDVVFGWTLGTLAAIGEELMDAPESQIVGAGVDDEGLKLFRRPDGFTAEQWQEYRDQADEHMEFIEWQIRRAARER